ncbi:hypothetical protein L0Z72_10460 [candidate division KSB1 bacterium]|nr:hypothetical protein [candidate division KSB1 bacterium]
MRYLKCFTLILLLFLTDVAFSQTILKRAKKYVIINIDQSFGLKENDQVNVHKKLISGDTQNAGTIKIILFKNGKCIGQIISESPEIPIAAGDFISMQDDYSAKQSKYSSAGSASSSGNNSLTYLSLGIGVVASGLGYYFLDQANQSFKDYEAAATSQDAVDLFDKTIDLDKKSKIGFGVGGGLIAVGLISYLINHTNPQPKSGNSFSLQPVWKNNVVGLGMSLSFNHPSRK